MQQQRVSEKLIQYVRKEARLAYITVPVTAINHLICELDNCLLDTARQGLAGSTCSLLPTSLSLRLVLPALGVLNGAAQHTVLLSTACMVCLESSQMQRKLATKSHTKDRQSI